MSDKGLTVVKLNVKVLKMSSIIRLIRRYRLTEEYGRWKKAEAVAEDKFLRVILPPDGETVDVLSKLFGKG